MVNSTPNQLIGSSMTKTVEGIIEGITIENGMSQYDLQQIINEPTHILKSSSSYLDLVLTSQPNSIVDFDVHPCLHPNCHHQIVFARFDSEIHYEHTPRHMNVRCGITNIQMLIVSDKKLICLTRKALPPSLMLMLELMSLTQLFQIYLVTLFYMKL